MTGKKQGTQNTAAKSGKQPKLNKRTLRDLAPAKGTAVRGGRGATTVIDDIGKAITVAGQKTG